MMIVAILMTVAFYSGAVYMSYVASFVLYKGFKYRLWIPTLLSLGFITVCYISIITDVVLLHSVLYSTISTKNGVLTLITIVSIITAKNGRENEK